MRLDSDADVSAPSAIATRRAHVNSYSFKYDFQLGKKMLGLFARKKSECHLEKTKLATHW
jgi:hypothetical protein